MYYESDSKDMNDNRLREIKIAEFEQFCDIIGQQAIEKGLTEEKLIEILNFE